MLGELISAEHGLVFGLALAAFAGYISTTGIDYFMEVNHIRLDQG